MTSISLAFTPLPHMVSRVIWPIIFTCSLDNLVNEILSIFMSLELICSFWQASYNRTSPELSGSIMTRLVSQLPCFPVMIKGLSSWGLMSRASSSEKVTLTSISPWVFWGKSWDITFVAKIWLAYFLRENLELPPPEKPPTRVFVL